jgi:hypothetical protein
MPGFAAQRAHHQTVAALGALAPVELDRQALVVLVFRLTARPRALAADVAELADRSQMGWWCHAPSLGRERRDSRAFTASSPERCQMLTLSMTPPLG